MHKATQQIINVVNALPAGKRQAARLFAEREYFDFLASIAEQNWVNGRAHNEAAARAEAWGFAAQCVTRKFR